MFKPLVEIATRICGNDALQRLLEKNVLASQYLMGIGAGSEVNSSGERILVEKLRQRQELNQSPLCVLDVGANRGQFLRLMLKGLEGVPALFHVFEPSRHAFQLLSSEFGCISNVQLNNFGLGKQREERELYYDQIGSGLASLSRRRLDHFGLEFNLSESVQIETLDSYCRSQQIERLDLLKLDVEGYELSVLEGGAGTFCSNRVQMLTFEFGGANIDSRTYFQDFWYLLRDYGMRNIFRITPSGHLVRIREYRESDEQFRTTNFLVSSEEL